MTRLKAQRKLHQAGKTGNWRFKGLMLAALDRDVSTEDVAQAWPESGQPSDYRFLSAHPTRDPEVESGRRVVAEKGEERHRLLSDFAGDETRQLSDDGTIGANLDSAIKRTLFAASTFEEVDTLFREQLLETVMEGAQTRKVAREASNVINADTRQGDVPVASDDEYASKVAQGAEIRDDREDYATVAWDCEKYGQGARVTDEMVDHAMVDMIERQIQYLGRSVENAINRVWLTELVDNANGVHDTAGSNQGYSALNAAFGVVDAEDFVPDTYVTHPEYRTTLYDDTNLSYANRAGSAQVLEDRGEGFEQIAGMDLHAAASGSTYDPNGSNTWGFAADGELGAVVYDRNQLHTVLYSPNGEGIEVKDYEDPIRDLRGVNARVHVDCVWSQQRAGAAVQY